MRIRSLLLLASSLLPPSVADSLVLDQRLYVDTLFSHGDIYTRSADSTLRARTDSLLAGAGESPLRPLKQPVIAAAPATKQITAWRAAN